MDVLDMGSNVGFFSLYVSEKVNSIDLIELNPKLCNICRKVRDKLKIKNVNIINSNIVEYNFNKKYDMIFSFAVHGHIGIGLHRYLELLHRLLNEGGLVLFETHRVNDCNMNERELTTERDNILRNEQKLFDIIHEGVIDDQMGRMRRFFYLKRR
jgi:16S rRNA G527 N7-methylase RsmG